VIVGVMEIDFLIYDSFSLKDKRRVVKSLIERVKHNFNVSIAEVDNLDKHNFATVGVAVVSNEHAFIDRVFDKLIAFVESSFAVEIVDIRRGQL